jgi:hypothetical protein
MEFYVALMLVTLIGPSLLWKCYKRRFDPSMLHLLQEEHLHGADLTQRSTMRGGEWVGEWDMNQRFHYTKDRQAQEEGGAPNALPVLDGGSSSSSSSSSSSRSGSGIFGSFGSSPVAYGGEQVPLVGPAPVPTTVPATPELGVQPLAPFPLLGQRGRPAVAHGASTYGYGATQQAAEALPLATVVGSTTSSL